MRDEKLYPLGRYRIICCCWFQLHYCIHLFIRLWIPLIPSLIIPGSLIFSLWWSPRILQISHLWVLLVPLLLIILIPLPLILLVSLWLILLVSLLSILLGILIMLSILNLLLVLSFRALIRTIFNLGSFLSALCPIFYDTDLYLDPSHKNHIQVFPLPFVSWMGAVPLSCTNHSLVPPQTSAS